MCLCKLVHMHTCWKAVHKLIVEVVDPALLEYKISEIFRGLYVWLYFISL